MLSVQYVYLRAQRDHLEQLFVDMSRAIVQGLREAASDCLPTADAGAN